MASTRCGPAQYYHFSRPGQLLTSGGFGTMGFGLGAAMGAKMGNPDKVVVHCTGDGCFRMNCHELSTVEHYNIPVITVIFDNGTLGMVRQWQNLIYAQALLPDRRWTAAPTSSSWRRPMACGASGPPLRRSSPPPSRRPWTAASGCVIDCAIDIDAMVHPMVNGGTPVTDFLLD